MVPVRVILSFYGTRATAAIPVEYYLLGVFVPCLTLVEGTTSAVLTPANRVGTTVDRRQKYTWARFPARPAKPEEYVSPPLLEAFASCC